MPDLIIDSTDGLLDALGQLREEFSKGRTITLSWKSEGSMTQSQRSASHVWMEQLARVLNEAGFDESLYFREYAKAGFTVPFTKGSVKRIFYKPTLDAITGKKSTEDMNTLEPSEICMIVGKALSERLGIEPPPFPSRFNLDSTT